MSTKYKLVISGMYFILLCCGLASCAIDSKNHLSEIPQATEINARSSVITQQGEPIAIPETVSKSSIEANRDETNDFRSNIFVDLTDYSQYLRKIWIAKDGGAYTDPFSFFITRIESGEIEGKYERWREALPDCHDEDFYSLLGDFTGVVNNGAAQCSFSSKTGDKGKVVLVFKGNNEIETTVTYEEVESMEKEQFYNDLYRIYNGTEAGIQHYLKLVPIDRRYISRPYNLSDYMEYIDPSKINSFVVDLNFWGKVNFVTVLLTGTKPTQLAFLTDKQGNILYKFRATFQTGIEFMDVFIEDLNGDGLQDIRITSNYDEYLKWFFYQMDDGLFYSFCSG